MAGIPFRAPEVDGGWRINFDNVFLSEEAPAGKLLLKAMDHTHCFTCGGDLTAKIARIERVRDERVFGLFKPFRRYLDRSAVKRTIQRLRALNRKTVQEIVQTIPKKWDVSPAARRALVDLIVDRARFVADDISPRLWPQNKFKFMDESENQP